MTFSHPPPPLWLGETYLVGPKLLSPLTDGIESCDIQEKKTEVVSGHEKIRVPMRM